MAVRSPKWPALAREHLRREPFCRACGTREGVVPHHKVPVHLDPSRELDPDNLVTLCPAHHLELGHGRDWRAFSPHVEADADLIARRIWERRYTL